MDLIIKKEDYNFIEKIEDLSDSFFKRMRIYFKNGYQLSVVISERYSYGGDEGLFEIAPMRHNDEFCPELFDEKDQGDDVLGYCDKERVIYYVNKIGNLKITKEQAIALFKSKFYEKLSYHDIVKFQLFEPRMCMPFSIFHEAITKVLKRPVYTHEFAFSESLKKEFLGEKPPPTFQEIIDLIPEDKRIIVLK